MQNPPEKPEPKPFVVLIIYAAFVAAMLLYLGIHFSGLLEGPEPREPASSPAGRILIYAAAAGCLLAGFILPRFVGASPDEFGLGPRVMQMVVRLASFEAIGVFGLVGVFVGLSRAESLGLLAFSLFLLLASGLWVLALYQSLSRPAEEHKYRR